MSEDTAGILTSMLKMEQNQKLVVSKKKKREREGERDREDRVSQRKQSDQKCAMQQKNEI